MWPSALFSVLHIFAFALGLWGVWSRGKALRALRTDSSALTRVFAGDNLWGVAALLWLGSGLPRAFLGYEKGTQYYLHSGPFLVKMALFALVFLLEAWPMVTFIRWRIGRAKGVTPDLSRVPAFVRINDVELVLVAVIPLFAAAMARGIGLTWFQ